MVLHRFWRRFCLAAGAALIACITVQGTADAAPGRPDAPPIVVDPTNPNGTIGPPSVGIGVTDGGTPGGPGAHGASQRGGARAGRSCSWLPAPDVEQFIRHLPGQLDRGVVPGQTGAGSGQDRVDPKARLFQRVCDGLIGGFAWFGPGQQTAAALPTPGELAREAYTQLRLPVPTPGHSPDLRLAGDRAAVLVGEHTWLWTDPTRFTARSKRLQVGPVWAQVIAVPVGLSFDPGNGEAAVACRGPGTAYVPGRYPAHAASPTCDYQYQRSSAGTAGGVVTAEYGITWQVRWTGAAGGAGVGGRLPDMISRAATTYAVAEAQALGTAGSRR
jgi:hypothetical protein